MPGRMPRRSWFMSHFALLARSSDRNPRLGLGPPRPSRHLPDRQEAHDREGPGRDRGVARTGETIADASTWADEHRRQLPKTAPWHYVDVPFDEPKYDAKWSADDPKKGCVVDKINEFRATLKDKTKSVEDRRFALRFLIHCVEDMHMPMHVG